MSRLSKQQQRRIVAQRENRLAAQEAENIATVVCHLGYHLVLEREGVLFAADWRRQSGDVVCNDQVLVKWIGERAIMCFASGREEDARASPRIWISY